MNIIPRIKQQLIPASFTLPRKQFTYLQLGALQRLHLVLKLGQFTREGLLCLFHGRG
jgi:hypothetical protein